MLQYSRSQEGREVARLAVCVGFGVRFWMRLESLVCAQAVACIEQRVSQEWVLKKREEGRIPTINTSLSAGGLIQGWRSTPKRRMPETMGLTK